MSSSAWAQSHVTKNVGHCSKRAECQCGVCNRITAANCSGAHLHGFTRHASAIQRLHSPPEVTCHRHLAFISARASWTKTLALLAESRELAPCAASHDTSPRHVCARVTKPCAKPNKSQKFCAVPAYSPLVMSCRGKLREGASEYSRRYEMFGQGLHALYLPSIPAAAACARVATAANSS